MADRKLFEKIAMPHLDAVYRAAVALCGSRSQADDLAQATFLKACQRFDSFQVNTNCKAWLLRILRNTWIDELRHRRVVGTELPLDEQLLGGEQDEQPEDWPEPDDLLEVFADEQIIRALQELPDDQRLTLYLVDVEQLSQAEAADVLDVAVGTVKSLSLIHI